MTPGQFSTFDPGLVTSAGGITGNGVVEMSVNDISAGETITFDGSFVDKTVELQLLVEAADNVVAAVTETAPNVFTIKGFDDIQAAIDDGVTDTGTDIFVGAGEYIAPRLGYIDVDKSVNLYGAQAGVDAGTTARLGGESVIRQSTEVESGTEFYNNNPNVPYATTAPSNIMLRVNVDDVTVDGFTFTDFYRDAINVKSLATEGSADLSGVTIANNRILMEGTKENDAGRYTDPSKSYYNQYNAIVFGEGAGDPARFETLQSFTDMEVSGNFIDIDHLSNTYSGARGVILTNHFTSGDGLNYDSFVISDNTIDTWFDVFVSGQDTKTFFSSGEISGNTFLGSRGLTGPNFDDTLIENNTFDTLRYGINISATDSEITNNTFETVYYWGVGLRDSTADGGVESSGNTVLGNQFTYNQDPDVENFYVGGVALHDESAAILADNAFVDGNASDAVVAYDVFEYVSGTAEADSFASTSSDEVFFGAGGADSFVFSGKNLGNDAIAGFDVETEVVDLSAYATGFEELTVTETGGNSIVTSGVFDGSITLIGVTELGADDFSFSSPM